MSPGIESTSSTNTANTGLSTKTPKTTSLSSQNTFASSKQSLPSTITHAHQQAFNQLSNTISETASEIWQDIKTIDKEYSVSQRALGGLKTAGGLAEATIGAVGVVAPEPLTTAGGGVLMAHGSDVAASGFNEMWTGKPQETFTDKAVTATAKALGANDATAHQIGDGVDMGISLGSAGVGLMQSATHSIIKSTPQSTIELESVLGKKFTGVKEASDYLKINNVPRSFRKKILESFDVRTLKVRNATNQEHGIRYFDNKNSWEKGRYLFETFPASRQNLALKSEWNQMIYMKQFKIRPNTIILEGRTSSMGVGVEGGKIQKYILDLNDLLEIK